MAIDTYEQALAYWLSRVDYEKIGMPKDLRTLHLGRMARLLDWLGRPQDRLSIVHVAGTKGKGSTAALIAAILQAAGYRTGLYTSPHLVQVEERIQINGTAIGPDELTRQMQRVEAAVAAVEAEGSQPLTFFEIITALSLLHFADQGVEQAVLEVGMGGRFDATNVCRPRVAVITSISFDHVAQLGPALADIAWAKAGIIKAGCPVVSGATAPDARLVIRWVARHLGAPLRELHQDFAVAYQPGDVVAGNWPRVQLTDARGPGPWRELHLWGRHQADNAALALETIAILQQQGVTVADEAVDLGLRAVRWPARLEVAQREPWLVLDCAHNPASIAATVEWFTTQLPARRRCLILAVSKDKDVAGIVAALAPFFAHAYLTRFASSQRSADPALLADLWRQAGGQAATIRDRAADALAAAQSAARLDEALLVTGSVFLAGEVRGLLRASEPRPACG